MKTGVVVLDRGTHWCDCFPEASKSGPDALDALNNFVGTEKTKGGICKYIYTDGSPELAWAIQQKGWCSDVSTPGMPQTNGVAERAVRAVVEGTRAVLLHSGFIPAGWTYA